MSEFNPVTLYFILHEAMGGWLWLLLALALLLLFGIVSGLQRLRHAGRSARRPLTAALAMGLAATVVFTFLVPVWSLAEIGALGAPVDYVFAVLLALVPAGIIASAVFSMAAHRCAGRARAA